MDTFFSYLKKSLVASMFMIFAVVAVYTPQDWNKIEQAEAGGAGGGALEVTQWARWAFEKVNNFAVKISTGITAFATNSTWVKENILDGIGWKIAKAIVSSMVQSLIKWINSGFKGSPMFVQDLGDFLRNAADIAIGDYISELGGIGSFLCSPFKLDIQIAVALEYQKIREGRPLAGKCTLSGVLKNIEDFTSGVQGSFSQGGWEAWFDITSNPTTYTPYGAALAAKEQAYVRILNTKGEEAAKVNWGSGFLSGEICNVVHGNGTSKEECFISKPGKVIQEALSFNLDSGRQSLIQADEFNEIIAALIGQLANQALNGAAGLLGLSAGTGYTKPGYAGGSYLDAMTKESNDLANTGKNAMEDARDVQAAYATLASKAYTALDTFSKDNTKSSTDRDTAKEYMKDAVNISTNAAVNEVTVDGLINDYEAAKLIADEDKRQKEQSKILSEFSSLTLYSDAQMRTSRVAWETLLGYKLPQ